MALIVAGREPTTAAGAAAAKAEFGFLVGGHGSHLLMDVVLSGEGDRRYALTTSEVQRRANRAQAADPDRNRYGIKVVVTMGRRQGADGSILGSALTAVLVLGGVLGNTRI